MHQGTLGRCRTPGPPLVSVQAVLRSLPGPAMEAGVPGLGPREVGDRAGGGACSWQEPVQTAVPCRCLWPNSVQCQGLEPDSSVTDLLGLLGGRGAGPGGGGGWRESLAVPGASSLLALGLCPLSAGPGLRGHWEQSL